MKLLREYIRCLLVEQNVRAEGMCFPFAYQKAEEWFKDHFTPGGHGRAVKRHPDLNDKSKFKVVHGTVTDKWKPKPIVHGWVEMGDLVFDDQTRHTQPNGVKKDDYYDVYQPEVYKEFTAEEAIFNCAKHGGEGPWDDDLYVQMQQRDAWLHEDSASRKQLATDLYNAGVRHDKWIGDPDALEPSERPKQVKDITDQGRILKKAFAKNADRTFLDSLVTVHWAYSGKSLRDLVWGSFSSRDEISTAAYLPGQIKGTGKFGNYGVLVKGHITLLANDMDQLYTGSTVDYTAADPERTKMSGANKGAQQIYEPKGYSEYKILVLDEEDWDPEVRGINYNQNNEALVDNWTPMALIIPDASSLPGGWSEEHGNEPAPPDTSEVPGWEELVEEAGLDIPVMTHKEFAERGWV
jgi:hypothetical protein